MKPTGLDRKTICDIIDSCAKGGVVKLKLFDMEVYFKGHDQAPVIEWLPIDNSEATDTPYLHNPQDSGQRNAQTVNTFDEGLLDDIRASQLMIDDPHGFEREIVNSHLRGE